MKLLIKAATIQSPASAHHGQIKNIFIENGSISRICDEDFPADQVIDIEGLQVSEGWADLFANFADPGDEYKEDLNSGAKAAAAGGFTDVIVVPNTRPIIHDKSMVEYLVQKGKTLPVNLHPLGAITKNAEGKELAEIYDMRESGALSFSDGLKPIQSAGIMVKALEYVSAFNGLVIQLPSDKSLAKKGLMNEGIISTRLGLPGSPALAEELFIARDLELANYANSRIHFTGISTQRSVELVWKAKAEGIQVTCSVNPAHLFFCDEDLASYDTNLKLNPPLRRREDMLYLRQAVKDGKIDCFASHHRPQDWDSKVCEFEYAKEGMSSLETVFAAAMTCGIPLSRFIEMQTKNLRGIFGLEESPVAEGSKAMLSLFLPEKKFTCQKEDFYSKSKNSAFIGKELTGLSLGIINGEKVFLKNKIKE